MSARADRKDYLSLVIHELRNPLVGIDAAARVLARDLETHAASQRASAIASEARHLLDLLESVSDAEAAASGRLRSTPRRLDLAGLVREAVAGSHLPGHPVRLRGTDAPVMVDADERRIRQVLANLLTNAAQYTGAGTPIEVTVAADPKRKIAAVEVRDHGHGIPVSERRRLFRKFARLSTADGTRGSGLGLYICRAIVEDHGGTIALARATSGGSTFVFTLPVKRSARASDVVRGPGAISARESGAERAPTRERQGTRKKARPAPARRTEGRDATGPQPGASPARALRTRRAR